MSRRSRHSLHDVTGTVTKDRLSVQEPYSINCKADDIILTACLAARLAERGGEVRDSIDMALSRALKRYPEAKAEINTCGILNRSPFNYDIKLSSASVELPTGERILYYKGAPLYIHSMSFSITLQSRMMLSTDTRTASKKSLSGVELLGFIPWFQGPRYNSVASIRLAKSLGLSVKFLAGFTDVDTAHTMKLVGWMGRFYLVGMTLCDSLKTRSMRKFPSVSKPFLA